MFNSFELKSEYGPAGDQSRAIKQLVDGVKDGLNKQTLLGVTGSGKTFAVANVIAQINKPTLVIAHNKTLAAQLAQEYRDFFPNNAVHYFVSYYDHYQPEAYMPITDTYIEKEATINEEIERLRHATTQALLTRKDVIIVASVSCIYGLGSPEEYQSVNLKLSLGDEMGRMQLLTKLIDIHYERTNADLKSGQMRAVGNMVEVVPVSEENIIRFSFDAGRISQITRIDAISRRIISEEETVWIFPAKHFITSDKTQKRALQNIKKELDGRLKVLEKEGRVLETERLKRRTNYDLALIREVGYCNGIENYSRHFSEKKEGEAPDTLLSYFPKNEKGEPDFLTVIDESHVSVPQLGGMYAGDQSRKNVLVEHGFRLPSAKDNRPLKAEEFWQRVGQTIFVSATPAEFELKSSECVAEMIVRPTGLLDPVLEVRPVVEKKGEYPGQVFDFISEAEKVIKKGERVLATTLTKKMAEDLAEYLSERGMRSKYLHSDVKTIERIEIISDFRRGEFDCLVGVNLLREGLDLPEVSLIGILDADKEGFLRSETSLIQTIGRAARNANGRVILYADKMTGSLERAIKETQRRRQLQEDYNKKHGITPKTIIKKVADIASHLKKDRDRAIDEMLKIDEEKIVRAPKELLEEKEEQMEEAVKLLDFETAAILRDEIVLIKKRIAEQMKDKTQLDRKMLAKFDKDFLAEFPQEKKKRLPKRKNNRGK